MIDYQKFSKKIPVKQILLVIFLLGATLTYAYIQSRIAIKVTSSENASESKSLDSQIKKLNQSLKDSPQNIKNYISLSQAYLQKVRDTADIAYYQKISDLLDMAEKIDPKNPDIFANRASVEIGRHYFKEGSDYAMKAILLNPDNHLYYGLLGDSQIELGQYKEAVESFQKMADLKPDYSAYIRIAYIRELYGDINGAKESLKLAISGGSSFPENIAFAYVELGKLNMRDSLDVAVGDFNSAIRVVADYPPALEGLGKVYFFKNEIKKSEDYFLQAYSKLPIVQYATDLGDLYFKEGKISEAKQYYTLAQLAFQKSSQSGVNTDLEESLFVSDHDLDLEKSLKEAERAYIARPSVYAADFLAWALYKNGKSKEAAVYKKEVLRLGEFDPTILFHQGMIAYENGDKLEGKRLLSKSLKINPYFSILHAGVVEEMLKK